MAVGVESLSGRTFRAKEVALIREIVADCSGLSLMELARTVCELLRWRRPNGSLKARERREFLERLEARGDLVLPDKRPGRAVGSVTRVPHTAAGEPGRKLVGLALGQTTGRGRMDRHHRRVGEAPKTILVYPLVRDANRRLRAS